MFRAGNVCRGPLLQAACLAILIAIVAASPADGSRMVKTITPKVSLSPVAFRDLPGWSSDNHHAALKAFVRSCGRVEAVVRSGRFGGRAPSPALLIACHEGMQLAKQASRMRARLFFEQNFVPHRVINTAKSGLFTGYYEPEINGSRTPTKTFNIPVYKRPPDLVNLLSEASRAVKGHVLTHARQTASGLKPFATRAEIEQGALRGKGLELVYLADNVDLFFMQVQGSGVIRLPDGSRMRLGYHGKNGHPYSSIGRYLINAGVMEARSMSLQALGRWLRADPDRGQKVMWQNKSYVFFRELKGEAGKGAVGVYDITLTAGRSLAVDTKYHAIGTPIYVTAPTLRHVHKGRGFNRLMVAQDVGSAIKGPERGDIYFGSGSRAARLAGVTKEPGKFFVLLPSSDLSWQRRTAKSK